MFKIMNRKERKIRNLKAMIINRDKLIKDLTDKKEFLIKENNEQLILINSLKKIIISLEEDLKSIKEEAYEQQKKSTTRKKTK